MHEAWSHTPDAGAAGGGDPGPNPIDAQGWVCLQKYSPWLKNDMNPI